MDNEGKFFRLMTRVARAIENVSKGVEAMTVVLKSIEGVFKKESEGD